MTAGRWLSGTRCCRTPGRFRAVSLYWWVAEHLAGQIPGASTADILATPFAWIGSEDEIRDKLQHIEDVFGTNRYVVRSQSLSDAARFVSGTP